MKWSKECCWVLWWMTDSKSQIVSPSLSIQRMMQTLMKVMATIFAEPVVKHHPYLQKEIFSPWLVASM